MGTAGGPDIGALAFLNALIFVNMLAQSVVFVAGLACVLYLVVPPIRPIGLLACVQIVAYSACAIMLMNVSVLGAMVFVRESLAMGAAASVVMGAALIASPAIVLAGVLSLLTAWRIAYAVPRAGFALWPLKPAAGMILFLFITLLFPLTACLLLLTVS